MKTHHAYTELVVRSKKVSGPCTAATFERVYYVQKCGILFYVWDFKKSRTGRKDFEMGEVLSLGNQFDSAAGLVPILLLTKLFGVSI